VTVNNNCTRFLVNVFMAVLASGAKQHQAKQSEAILLRLRHRREVKRNK